MNFMFIRRIEYEKQNISKLDEYPYNIPCLKKFKALEFHSPVTFLIGENGSGKSTLIEAIALLMKMNPEGGTNNFQFQTNNTISSLYQYLKVVKTPRTIKNKFFLRAESFYNFSTELDRIQREYGDVIQYYGGKSLHEQSHGESFMAVMKNRFGKEGLYILDEPEAALSPTRQMSLLILIQDLIKQGSQFIIATHSPILLSFPNAEIYNLEKNMELISYEETDYYQLYQLFINNKERILHQLLGDFDETSHTTSI